MDSPKTPDNSVTNKIKSSRKSYKIEYKLKIIREYKKTKNYYALSKQTNINISTLIEWVNREYEFKQESNRKNNKRLSGSGRKLIYPADFDSGLLAWFNNERENKRGVSYKQLKQEAEKRSGKTITLWWIRGFVRRFNLSIRKKYNSALVQLNEVTTTVSELKIRINDLQHTVREQQKHLEYNKRLSSTSKQLFLK